MQPEIENGTSYGHVEIDIVKDDNVKGWPKIVLDINNITITKAQGELRSASTVHINRMTSRKMRGDGHNLQTNLTVFF